MQTLTKSLHPLTLLAVLLATSSVSAQTVTYLHTDPLGSVVAESDSGGNVTRRVSYDPYGAVIGGDTKDGPGYTGHVSDASTGLSYMQQRYMDPQLGVFLSVDPVTAYQQPYGQFNRYRYANSSPYTYKDPDGRLGCTGSRIEANCGDGGSLGGPPSVRAGDRRETDTGGRPVQHDIPSTVRSEMKRSWTDSRPGSPSRRHEEGGYYGTEKSNGDPGTRRWPRGDGASVSPPRREADGSYQGLNVKGEWHSHPNPPVDGLGRAWTQGGHSGDWDGIRSENYRGDSYIISDRLIYKIDNQGREAILGPRSDL